MDSISVAQIPVFRPLLPTAEKLLPYLQEIDAHRWYSNAGPLLGRFEFALAAHFDVAADRVTAVANATAGLTLCLLATTAGKGDAAIGDAAIGGAAVGRLCIMPSWTHEATAVAVLRAGLIPWFHDVDENTWMLDPGTITAVVAQDPRVAAVVVTAPFGAAVDQASWAALTRATGAPVIIDAAAGFDSLRGGPLNAVVSLHATKVLGIGEGGAIIAANAETAARLRHLAQLGLSDERVMGQAGLNAKLSEYGAAVGLAALKEWPARRAHLHALRQDYAAAMHGDRNVHLWLPTGISSTLMARFTQKDAVAVAADLSARGVETRRWWRDGCHRQPALSAYPCAAMPVTEALANSVLGLPFHADMTGDHIARVVAALQAGEATSAN